MSQQWGCQPADQEMTPRGQPEEHAALVGELPAESNRELAVAEVVGVLSQRLSENLYLEYIYNCKNGLRKCYQRQLKPLRIEKTRQSCQVCQCPYQRNDIVLKTPCQHLVHKQCSKPWFKVSASCPICRLDLNKFYQEHQPPVELTQK